MSVTNYTAPASGAYRLVRIRKKQAEILEPTVLDEILSVLEAQERGDLWEALYKSQPFHSTTCDPTGETWRAGRPYPEHYLTSMFAWAAQRGLIPPPPSC